MASNQNQYQHWDGQGDRGTVVVRDDENEVHIPRVLRQAQKNHKYGRTVNQEGVEAMRYYHVPYEHQDFPRVIYHPEYHTVPAPILNDFKSMGEYNAAVLVWKRKYDRTMQVESDKEFKRLTGKGWLPKPPEVATPKDDPHSEEI